MKKTVPFKKELYFKENIEEVTSISLEHTLHSENDNQIVGEFIVTGEYKKSINTEQFEFRIPFFITIDEKYDMTNSTVDIEDFYYETKNNILNVNIEVLLDKLELKEIEETNEEKTKTINEDYVTYKVYIVKENDTIQTIMNNYKILKEDLTKYNNIDNILVGDKLIIPTND